MTKGLHTLSKISLPNECWELIFEYDSTWKEFFSKKVLEEFYLGTGFWKRGFYTNKKNSSSIIYKFLNGSTNIKSYDMDYKRCRNLSLYMNSNDENMKQMYGRDYSIAIIPINITDKIPNKHHLFFKKIKNNRWICSKFFLNK